MTESVSQKKYRAFATRALQKADTYTTQELANVLKRTRGAIFIAIKKGRIKAFLDRKTHHYVIKAKDVQHYIDTQYNRGEITDHKGRLIYDNSKSRYSIAQLADILGVKQQRIYYAISKNRIPFKKYRSQYVLHVPDKKKFMDKLFWKKKLLKPGHKRRMKAI